MDPTRSLLQNISTDALMRRELIPICVIRDSLLYLNGRGAALLGRPDDEFPKLCRCAKSSPRRIGRV